MRNVHFWDTDQSKNAKNPVVLEGAAFFDLSILEKCNRCRYLYTTWMDFLAYKKNFYELIMSHTAI